MKKILPILFASIIILNGCKPLENSIVLAETKTPVVRKDITFSYSDDQVRHTENNIKQGWANRNNIQVLHITIINNANHVIHGSQLSFLSEGKKLEIVNNELASKKLKSRKFPRAVYIVPIAIVGIVLYAGLIKLLYGDDYDGDFQVPEKSDKAKDPLYKANIIQKELYKFNVAKEFIHPNEQISGFIAFKSKRKIHKLNILVNDTDYVVVPGY